MAGVRNTTREYMLSMELRVGLECAKWIMFCNGTTWLKMIRAFEDTLFCQQNFATCKCPHPYYEKLLSV
jgi:hypothetical protein